MSELNKKQRNQILGVLFVGVLMGALDIAIVGPALPAIRRSFAVDDRALAWVFTSYVLFNLIGTMVMAKLSDAFGRRAIYVLDVLIFAVGSLVVALSPAFWVVLVGRAVQGFGAGGIFPVASAVIGDTFPPEKRGSALGLIGAVFGLAFLIGPVVGGVILRFWGWHWLFLINLPIAAMVIAAAWRLLPAAGRAERLPFDWGGMVTLSLLLAALTYGLNRLDTTNIGASLASVGVWPFLLGAVLFFFLFVRMERGAGDPVLRLSLFRSRQVRLAAGLAWGSGLGEAAIVFVPALLVAAFGVTESQASFMLLPPVLAMAVGSPLAGQMLDRAGSRVVVIGGTALTMAGMALAGFFPTVLAVYYTAAVLIGLGLSALLGAPLRYILLNETSAAERGVAQGALTLFTSIGQMMGAAFVGAVAASMGGGVPGYSTAYRLVALVFVVLVAFSMGLKSRAEEMATARRHEEAVRSTSSP